MYSDLIDRDDRHKFLEAVFLAESLAYLKIGKGVAGSNTLKVYFFTVASFLTDLLFPENSDVSPRLVAEAVKIVLNDRSKDTKTQLTVSEIAHNNIYRLAEHFAS